MTGAATVRARLHRETASAHHALHDHAWIGQLASPTLTRETYSRLIRAYAGFHAAVEARRAGTGAWPALSLAPCADALARDLATLTGTGEAPQPAAPLPRDRAGLLGALYVMHGARFGAATLDAGIARALPDAPRHFFSRRADPAVWRCLLRALDAREDAYPAIRHGANATFAAFGTHVAQICETSSPVVA